MPLGARVAGRGRPRVTAGLATIQLPGPSRRPSNPLPTKPPPHCHRQIDVLLVDGVYYGFSGCHRFEAHQRLGLPAIRCRVRKASREILRMHMM